MVLARRKLSDSGGQITMRRLNRREYHNTIESLTGVSLNVDPFLLMAEPVVLIRSALRSLSPVTSLNSIWNLAVLRLMRLLPGTRAWIERS